MNTAIKIIQDRIEGIKRTNKILLGSDIGTSQIIVLEEIIDEISYLPSLDSQWIDVKEKIKSIKRYSPKGVWLEEDVNGDRIYWKDLLKTFNIE